MDAIQSFATPWKIGLAIVVFAVLAIIAYNMFKSSSKKEAMTTEEKEEKVCELFFFYTEWCPYCKKAKPEWERFKAPLENTSRNEYKFVFHDVDCDKDEALASKYNVVGYPTIKLLKDGKITEYDAKTSVSTLNAFVDSCF